MSIQVFSDFTAQITRATTGPKAGLISFLLFGFVATLTAPAEAADALKSYGNWSIFVEEDPKPKTCWTATSIIYDPRAKQHYFLAVSRYRGRRDPEVSIYSDKRMQRSTAIYLTVSDRKYGMRSDGTAAWPEKRTDKRIIADMLKVSKAPKPSDRVVYAGQTGGLEVKTRIDGLGQALDMVLKECSRP